MKDFYNRYWQSNLPGKAIGIIEMLALGILLALIDAIINIRIENLPTDHVITVRSLTWMAIFYGGATLLAAMVFRRRPLIFAIVAGGFVFAQGMLWLYRTNLEGSLFSTKFISLFIGFFVISIIVAWFFSKLPRWLPVRSSATTIFVGCVALAGGASFLLPASPPDPPAPWPVRPINPSSSTTDRPNILLLTLDTLRPDHLGVYGYDRILTPNLDALAHNGALFLRAKAQAPLTPVSHASILSGALPTKHGLRNFTHNNQPSTKYPLLSEVLRKAGYLTGAIIAADTLHPAFGLDRGFDVYHYVRPSGTYFFTGFSQSLLPTSLNLLGIVKDHTAYRSGREQTDDTLRWLDRYKATPFFLWVHYFDPHDPYLPSAESQRPERHPGRSWKDRFGSVFMYDSEIVGLDDEIGRIIDRLREYDLLDNTIIAVIADHGEGLGEHNYFGHTKRLYEEQLRIPLFLHYPKKIPAGMTVDTQVRSTDLMPTLLELLDLPVPDGLDGASLIPLLRSNAEFPDRIAFSETFAASDTNYHLIAVSDGQYKLIKSLGGEKWLFDLKADPAESQNLAGSRPSEENRLEAMLDSYLGVGIPLAGAQDKAKEEDLSEELKQKLKSLGYLD